MLHLNLLNYRYYKMITSAPCDYIRNKMILEHVRQKETSCLFKFLDILQRAGNHEHIYEILTNGKELTPYY